MRRILNCFAIFVVLFVGAPANASPDDGNAYRPVHTSLGQAIAVLQDSSGYKILVHPKGARRLEVKAPEPDDQIHNTLAYLLRDFNYAIHRLGARRIAIQILGTENIVESVAPVLGGPDRLVLPDDVPRERPNGSHIDGRNDIVELTGPGNIRELVRIPAGVPLKGSVDGEYIDLIGPNGIEERVRFP